MNTLSVYEKLIEQSIAMRCLADPLENRLDRAIKNENKIPDICKPGYLLNNLTEKERKALGELQSDDAKNHMFYP
jgi:hypothetical protein